MRILALLVMLLLVAPMGLAADFTVRGGNITNVSRIVFSDGTVFTGNASGNVTGSGTASYIPRWSSVSALVASILYDNATAIGVRTASPTGTLDVNGTTTVSGVLTMGTAPAQCSANYAMTSFNGSHAVCTLFNTSAGSGTVGPGTVTQLAYFNSTTTIAGGSNLCWNNSAGYLGIGTCTPGAALDVNGNVQIGGVFTAYGSGVSDFTNGDVKLADTNITGYVNLDTPSANDCIDFKDGGAVCGNTTCTWIESPNGATIVQACN